MKHLIFIVLLSLSACNNSTLTTNDNLDKAKKNIKDWLTQNLKDPSSYQSVMFYPLMDDETQPPDTSSVTINLYMAQMEDYDANFDEDLCRDRRHNGWYEKRKVIYKDSLIKEANRFRPVKKGFYIFHAYRAKNGFGGLDLYHTCFYFDMKMNIINERENAF